MYECQKFVGSCDRVKKKKKGFSFKLVPLLKPASGFSVFSHVCVCVCACLETDFLIKLCVGATVLITVGTSWPRRPVLCFTVRFAFVENW